MVEIVQKKSYQIQNLDISMSLMKQIANVQQVIYLAVENIVPIASNHAIILNQMKK